MTGDGDDHEKYVEAVLSCVEQIPPGYATTYSRIAETVGRGGPRQVGRVLALYGAAVPWWRVVRADGTLPPSHGPAALEHYVRERTPLTSSAAGPRRVDLGAALWRLQDG